MTELDLSGLRAKAEAALSASPDHRVTNHGEFVNACGEFEEAISPSVVIALLDRVEKAEADGWLYLNPDTGVEISDQHPVESGECDDAENVRPATASELRILLTDAWGEIDQMKGMRAEIARLRAMLARAGEAFEKIARSVDFEKSAEIARTAALAANGQAAEPQQPTWEDWWTTPHDRLGGKRPCDDTAGALELLAAIVHGLPA